MAVWFAVETPRMGCHGKPYTTQEVHAMIDRIIDWLIKVGIFVEITDTQHNTQEV